MKKLVNKAAATICVAILALIAALGGITLAYVNAGTFEEECDLVFRQALEEILEEEGVTAPTVEVTKEPIYDIALEQLGFLYLMEYGLDGEGFAIVINTDGIFGVAEFYMEGANPYAGYDDAQYIYVKLLCYLVFQDDSFIEPESGVVLDQETVGMLSQKALYSGGGITSDSETIYYTNKTANTLELALQHPAYTPAGLSNACVPAAGANVIGYWTRYYSGLASITPGYTALGYYLYYLSPNGSEDLTESLYYAMGTNTTGSGTTIAQFKSGMTSYVSGKGRSISYTSTITSGSFNYSLTKSKLADGLPLVLFVDGFRVDSITNGTGWTGLSYIVTDACHAMAGFGYNEVTYTLTSGGTRTDTYIQVATGLGTKSKGYYNIYYNTQVDECFAITIS
ncbi:MAG: hypothetical protein FWD58_08350 [Firmicutes bacterium]|nr:hypothetical protein [Bacillota bacterium]